MYLLISKTLLAIVAIFCNMKLSLVLHVHETEAINDI